MAVESEKVAIPEVDIWEFLFEGEGERERNDQVVFQDAVTLRQYTFRDVKSKAVGFGQALLAQWDWQKGDVLAIFLQNSIETPVVVFGTMWAGGIVSPANPSYSATELSYQLKDCGAKALVTQFSALPVALEAAKIARVPLSHILVIDGEEELQITHLQKFSSSSSNFKPVERVHWAHHDVALLFYSSGTSGLPKGVMLSNRNIISNAIHHDFGLAELSCDDIAIGAIPFYHIYGFATLVVTTIRFGCKCLVMPRFDLEAFCKAIQDYKITFAYVVPPILLSLSNSSIVLKYNLSSVRIAISAAAPLNADLILAVWRRLRIPVKQAYGISETSPGVTIQRYEDWNKTMGSVGTLFPNQSLKIMLESGEQVTTDEDGEIWVKGPNVFVGYLNNPGATSKSMTSDGYYKTGDIGHLDKDNNLWITDRLKELIKYKGFQVPPAELEGMLLSHEKVADVCVIGVYDAGQATEIPRAYVVKSSAAKDVEDTVLEEELVGWANDRLANHKKLRGGMRFVDAIPKSAAGKILRRVVRDRVRVEEATKAKSKL